MSVVAPATQRTGRGWPLVLGTLLCMVVAAWAGWFEAGDPDAYWHAAIGRFMWQQQVLPPFPDPLSFTATGPFTFGEPISDLLWFALYAHNDVWWIVCARSAVVALWALLLCGGLKGDAAARVAVAFVVIAVSTPQLVERPYLLSFLLFTGCWLWTDRVAARLQDSDVRGLLRPLAVLGVAGVLWANIHRSGFLLGPVVAALAWGAFRAGVRRPAWYAALAVPPALAILANPAGLEVVRTAVESLSSRSHDISLLEEWAPLSWRVVLFECPALLALLALAAVGLRTRRNGADVIVVGVAMLLCYRARFVPYLAVALAPPACAGATALLHGLTQRVRAPLAWVLAVFLGASVLVAQALLVVPAEQRHATVARRIPLDALAWMVGEDLPAPVWNHFDAGGPLTWAAGPLYRSSIDGRLGNTLFPRELVDRAFAAPGAAMVGREVLREHGARAVLATSGFQWLHQERDWRLVYRDDVAALWVRAQPDTAAWLRAHPELDAARDDRRDALLARCRDADALGEVEAWLEEAPASVIAWQTLRACMRVRGDVEGAADAHLLVDVLSAP